jgi:prepilin-type N-terminal cleavage/methylation domain-containing protein
MKNRFQRYLRKLAVFSSGEGARARGMTLVETLVAIAILGVSVTAFILALSTGTIATRNQGEDVRAQGLAQTQMETIKAAAYDITGASYTAVSTPPGYAIDISTDSSLYSNNSIQKVTVAVSHAGSTLLTLEGYKVDR